MRRDLALLVVATLLVVIAIALAGCAARPIAAAPGAIRQCGLDTYAHQSGVCPNTYTTDGYLCVICSGPVGCVDTTVQVFCVSSCLDRHCAYRGAP